jgi:hypothetical protein
MSDRGVAPLAVTHALERERDKPGTRRKQELGSTI